MTVTATSRYWGNKVAPITDASGVTRLTILPASAVDTTYTVSFYAWKAGDRMDLLGYRFYGDEKAWWLIADANPEISNWFTVAPGTIIRIPVD